MGVLKGGELVLEGGELEEGLVVGGLEGGEGGLEVGAVGGELQDVLLGAAGHRGLLLRQRF